MSIFYINKTRKPSKSNYSVSELVGYQVCPSELKNGTRYILTKEGQYYDKAEFFRSDDFDSNDTFRTWNEASETSAPITIEKSSTGELYLKSKPNNTTTDNLQELPNV